MQNRNTRIGSSMSRNIINNCKSSGSSRWDIKTDRNNSSSSSRKDLPSITIGCSLLRWTYLYLTVDGGVRCTRVSKIYACRAATWMLRTPAWYVRGFLHQNMRRQWIPQQRHQECCSWDWNLPRSYPISREFSGGKARIDRANSSSCVRSVTLSCPQ